MNLFKLILGALLAMFLGPAAAQDKTCAMVLIHGKWGNTAYISHFGRRIEAVCAFKAIEMPWSTRRAYDIAYPDAIEEIAKEVEAFRAQGFKKIVIGGHSFGVNAGLAYMATKANADAVLGLGPGHSPRTMFNRGMNKEAILLARELVKENKGDEKISFVDLNQSNTRSFSRSATIFLSYFDPEGLGTMSVSAKAFKKSVPVMIVVGTRDPVINFTKAEIYPNLPSNPLNKLVIVDGDHDSTVEAAVPFALEWLKEIK